MFVAALGLVIPEMIMINFTLAGDVSNSCRTDSSVRIELWWCTFQSSLDVNTVDTGKEIFWKIINTFHGKQYYLLYLP